MATELEFKLAVPNGMLLEKILFDEQVAQVRQEGYRMLEMASVYYDTPERSLRTRGWTLRLRQENQRNTAQCDGVSQFHLGRIRHNFSVDPGSSLGSQIIYRPDLIPSPTNRRVLARNGWIAETDV